jgi:tungstate transport system ATP-binding protein
MLYELTRIEKLLGGRRILDIPSLMIRPGRIYSLTGPNGAGKTTLLQILALLDRPTFGEIHFRAEKVRYEEKYLLQLRRQVVLVDQSPLLFTGTVARNVEFGLRMRKIAAAERKRRVVEVLQQVGMTGFMEAEAHKLSGGETKRVALARALAVRPQVLLCDEPTANVDRENQQIILDILAGLNRTEKTSIIFSTHYLSQEQELAHHCLQLRHGSISETTAENVFQAELVEQEGNRATYRLPKGLTLNLPRLIGNGAPTVHLSIDQASIRLSRVDEPTGNLVEGRVNLVQEEVGGVRVRLDAGIALNLFLSLDVYHERSILVGELIRVVIPDTAVRCIADDGSENGGIPT